MSKMGFRNLLRVPVTKFGALFRPRFRGTRPSFTVWRTTATKGPNGEQNGDTEQQQLSDVYNLGRMTLDLKMINDETITTSYEESSGLAVYKEYQKLASKFNITLKDPPLGKIDREEKQRFLCQQIGSVEKYISKNKPNNIRYLYKAAVQVEEFRRILENNNNNLVCYVKNIKEAAQNLDVHIEDELNQLGNFYNFDTGCINRIKTKLCKVKPTVTRSEVDRTRIITNEYWAVSLVQMPYILHGDHVFLVLEGKKDDKSMIWFADFVAHNLVDIIWFKIKEGRVRIDFHEEVEVGAPVELLYRCEKKMMKITKDSRLLYSTWSIPRSKADLLRANLENQQANPPNFSVLAKTGHNCFTFAKNMLHDLKDDYIQVPGDKVGEWSVYAAATRDPSNNQRWITLWLRMLGAGRGLAYAILKLLNFFYKKNS